MRTLQRELPATTFPVSASDTTSGASPLTVDTTGVASGDLCFFLATSTNSALDPLGPEDGGWTELWMLDISGSDEEMGCWYKVAGGSEPSTWTWDHGAGVQTNALMLALRGPSFVASNFARNVTVGLGVPGIGRGGQMLIHVFHECGGGDPGFTPAPDYESTAASQYTAAWLRPRNPWPVANNPYPVVTATAGITVNLAAQGIVIVG